MDPSEYSIPASHILKSMRDARIDFVTTVPDFIQLSVHAQLEKGDTGIQYVRCTTEEQATTTAAGLIIGGKRPLMIIQNQGFFACINAVRGAGLDAGLPIVYMIGQFGPEDEIQGQDPATSARRVVRLMEPMLDVLGMKCLKLDAPGDEEQIPDFFQTLVDTMSPAAILVGARTAWDA